MKVKDPVCGMMLDADQAVAKIEHAGQTYYFCSDACRKRFDAEPAKYAPAPRAHLGHEGRH